MLRLRVFTFYGHVFLQTKDLIAEIELLEEEIANREQHVLFLYRSIFDQCISAPSSRQSSGVASPAHPMNVSKKHPSIISSTFCSSKKFSLQPFQVLASIKESGKGSVLRKHKFRHETPFGRNISTPVECNGSDLMKVRNNQSTFFFLCNALIFIYVLLIIHFNFVLLLMKSSKWILSKTRPKNTFL